MTRLSQRLSTPLPHITRLSTFEDDGCHRWGHLSRTLLWGDSSVVGRPSPVGTAWLADLSWLICREPVGTAFAAKGGNNAEPHNHLDLGSFILAVAGEQLLADLGSGVYDAAYFGPERYGALHTSAAGHSVPIVAGVDQRPGEDSVARVIDQVSTDEHVGLELDLSEAYAGQGFHRRFDWRSGHRLELTDRFDEPGRELVERFISRVEPELDDDRAVWRGERGRVTLYHSGDWRTEVERIDTLDHHAKPETVYRLTLNGITASVHRFEFVVELDG
ncbi:heparinase II/III family protein [Stackebrandtia endophytica]|nr:heparinase II/III family protein [Stackebrandtia endophytica]